MRITTRCHRKELGPKKLLNYVEFPRDLDEIKLHVFGVVNTYE